MTRPHRSVAGLGLLAVLCTSSLASAEGTALDRFDPSPAGDRFFGVQAPSTRGHLDVHAASVLAYGHNPYILTHRRGVGDVGNVVEHQMNLHLAVGFSLWERLNLSLDMPFAVLQGGSDESYFGTPVAGADGAAVGDLRLGARGSILGKQGDVFQLGVGGYLWFPTGTKDDFVSDETVRGSAELLLGGLAGPVVWNFSFGPYFRKSHKLIGIQQGNALVWGAGLGVLLGDEQQVQVGPEAKVAMTIDDPKIRNTNAEILLGAKYRFADYFELGAAAGPGIAEGIGTPDFRGVVSFGFTTDVPEPKRVDQDGDGIDDRVDACPGTSGPATDDPETNGCPPPPPPPDTDGDSIADDTDACPNVAGIASEDPSWNGCPPDADGDGVRDDLDLCPNVAPAPDAADPARPGCAVLDADADGLADGVDACPNLAGVASDDAAQNGCPPDSDGDGFRDDQDACPNLRGGDDADPAKKGCPKAVRLTGKQIQILQQVQFATGTANIKDESSALLDEVAQALKDHPELTKIEVAGHTDDRGSKFLNTRLSLQRAEAVMRALVGRGVEASRLEAKGYGPDSPIADNGTDEGRAKNRRVEFRIVERKKKAE